MTSFYPFARRLARTSIHITPTTCFDVIEAAAERRQLYKPHPGIGRAGEVEEIGIHERVLGQRNGADELRFKLPQEPRIAVVLSLKLPARLAELDGAALRYGIVQVVGS